MGKLTSQRRRGQREDVHVPSNAQAREDTLNNSNGNGEINMSGTGTQKKPDATFEDLVRIVADFDVANDSIAMAWHPEPKAEMLSAKRGWVRVMKGKAGYDTNSGLHVDL